VVGVTGGMAGGDPVEEYLDQLYARLRTRPREGRRLLAEAEDHLREGVTEGQAAGLSEREAAEHAISSFGSVRAVVRAHERRRRQTPAALFGELAVSAWKLISVGLLAVGASGLVAAVMNAVAGPGFVGGAPTTTGVTPADCQHYLTIWRGAGSCAQAAVLETASDAVSLRVAAGILGLMMLGTYLLTARGVPRTLPDGFVPTVAVAIFGTAGAGLAAVALLAPAQSGLGGPGCYLSGAIASLAVAAMFAVPLRRTLFRHARG
jgi:hypothetical protein